METFSAKWFVFYYLVLGVGLFGSGFLIIGYSLKVRDYLKDKARSEVPPLLLRKILKYFFLFTIPCIFLSLTPFSWVELLFSIWSLFMVYILGIQMVRWEKTRTAILDNPDKLELFIRITGAIMVSLSFVMFALSYLVIQ